MDNVSRSYYEMCFKLAFLERKGDAFQDLFSTIMEKRYPGDFIRVRPWGNVGDRKNDGYLRSRRTLFQVYGPNELTAEKAVTKIREDFEGALPHWQQHFSTWVFVHNSRIGLGPDVLAVLLECEQKEPQIKVVAWGSEELRREAIGLGEVELASLFGPAPTREVLMNLGLEDLAPVLDHIQRFPITAAPDLRPVPSDKLQRNMLSDDAATLLKAGMSRADLVRQYFTSMPIVQDQIAESFRAKYAALRASASSPDTIFMGLQAFAGGDGIMLPARMSAVLAVLAFFFEECDIFERPVPPETET